MCGPQLKFPSSRDEVGDPGSRLRPWRFGAHDPNGGPPTTLVQLAEALGTTGAGGGAVPPASPSSSPTGTRRSTGSSASTTEGGWSTTWDELDRSAVGLTINADGSRHRGRPSPPPPRGRWKGPHHPRPPGAVAVCPGSRGRLLGLVGAQLPGVRPARTSATWGEASDHVWASTPCR